MFQAHIELLDGFLNHREAIVERIQGVLNAQRRPVEYLQDGALLARQFEDGFFIGTTQSQSRLRGQLEAAHWADGFRPRAIAGLHNGLINPAELMVRAFHLWQLTRWPGRNGRVRYAQTLFNLYVVRCLELLSMRLWDEDAGSPGERLSDIQGLLDRLWALTPADQPVVVRDARWLIQLAQSPATDDLGAYFEVAARIERLPRPDRLVVHSAGARMAAGHLRSQIRYYCLKQGLPLDEPSLIQTTRTTNALDFALLIQDLVPLLEAYEHACRDADDQRRRELAGAICQGISPDPELFLNRVELLTAYSMIEHLFVTTDHDGTAVYTPMGRRHVDRCGEYSVLIGRAAKALHDDCAQFRPVAGAYSPYGVLYGFSSNLIEHMAFKALQPEAVTRFGLEDVFADRDTGSDKLNWVTGWRKLPHLKRDVETLFDYPQQFAEEVFHRVETALGRRMAGREALADRTGCLFVLSEGDSDAGSWASGVPHLAAMYIGSSDRQLVDDGKAAYRDEALILSDRSEGRCVLSFQTSGGWIAISKAVLTDVLGAGHDAALAGLPPAAASALKLMCPGLVIRSVAAR